MADESRTDNSDLELLIVVAPEVPVGEKSVFRRGLESTVTQAVRADHLANSIGQVCRYVGRVFEHASTAVRDLELDTLEVQVELTGSGEVRLIGAVTAEIKGGLTLTFKKPSAG